MVNDHSDSEKQNPLPPHRLLFLISSKGSFRCIRLAHTTAFVTPVVEHWLEREIDQWVHPMKDRSDDPSHHERTLLPLSYISLHDLYTVRLAKLYSGQSSPPAIAPSANLYPLSTTCMRIVLLVWPCSWRIFC